MVTWTDKSFTYKNFKCIWNTEKNHFEIREGRTAYFMGYAVDAEKAKKIIDKEVGK